MICHENTEAMLMKEIRGKFIKLSFENLCKLILNFPHKSIYD